MRIDAMVGELRAVSRCYKTLGSEYRSQAKGETDPYIRGLHAGGGDALISAAGTIDALLKDYADAVEVSP